VGEAKYFVFVARKGGGGGGERPTTLAISKH